MRAARCEMVTGFLVPHRCPNAATGTCVRCKRQYCDDHLEVTAQGLLCDACREGRDEPYMDHYHDFDDDDFHVFDADENETFIDNTFAKIGSSESGQSQ
jgi:hypothetical protein